MRTGFPKATPAGRAAAAAAVVTVVAALTTGIAAGQAALGCGAVISHDMKLTADVGPCPGAGLIVAADGVTLDLNGHTVVGNPQARGDGPDAPGILLRKVHRATVENGTVRAFDAGVVIDGGGDNTVTAVIARDNLNYRLVTGRNALPDDIDPKKGPFCDLGDGIAVINSANNTVKSNQVAGNGPFSGIALIGPSMANTLANNAVVDNDVLNQPPTGEHGTICGGLAQIGPLGRWTQDVGVRIEGPGAQHNVVDGNGIFRSSLAGVMVTAFVTDFPMANNGFNEIRNNTISQTGLRTHQLNDFGDEYRSTGIFLHNSGSRHVALSFGNVIADNNSSNNFGGGIEALGPFPGSGQVGVGGNTIVDNVADNNLLDGINLAEGTVDTTVSRNTAYGNAPDRELIKAINARDIYTVWAGTDGADMSARCDHNYWSENSFGTVNQKCVAAHGGTGKVIGSVSGGDGHSAQFVPSSAGSHLVLRRGGPNA